MKRYLAAAAGAALLAGLVGVQADAAASPADLRYRSAVGHAGFDPADPYWAQYAKDVCASLRDGRSARETGDRVYVYGAAVGAYCVELAGRTWYNQAIGALS